jgi:hypothetical protein
MDLESQRTSVSKVYFSRAKRLIVILAFVAVLALEIYTSYSVTPSSSSGDSSAHNKLNIGKFLCNEDIRFGDGGLRLKICNKLISIFKNFNSTVRETVSLTENEWSELDSVLRR